MHTGFENTRGTQAWPLVCLFRIRFLQDETFVYQVQELEVSPLHLFSFSPLPASAAALK